ncbi:hypothetical protein ENBRE01_2126, partial [Enteropsectra breve]
AHGSRACAFASPCRRAPWSVFQYGAESSAYTPVFSLFTGQMPGEVIPQVERYVYLGVKMNRAMDLDTMAQYRTTKGRRTLGTLMRPLAYGLIPIDSRRCSLTAS